MVVVVVVVVVVAVAVGAAAAAARRFRRVVVLLLLLTCSSLCVSCLLLSVPSTACHRRADQEISVPGATRAVAVQQRHLSVRAIACLVGPET